MSQIDLLYRLQQTENSIKEGKKRLAEAIRLQSESAELIKARKEAAEAEATLRSLTAQRNDINLALEGISSKAKRSEDRLYSGVISNPKELADQQNEIESLNRRIGALEDELLEAMIIVEEAEEEVRAASARLEKVEEEWAAKAARAQEDQEKLISRLSELEGQKAQVQKLLTPAAQAAYEAAYKRAGPNAVVALKDGRCRGCLLRVSANQIKAADEGQMVICDNCARILCPV